uniref:Uncharacterized protein n=1 Tax=Vespula pensylvanica TaxID=30213 RepID=A0A834UD30_VESPE|nr:hypothetical protein H0235_004823 [Vespula pensylvanica]
MVEALERAGGKLFRKFRTNIVEDEEDDEEDNENEAHSMAEPLWFRYYGAGDRSYRTGSDTEGAATTDNPTTPFPTPPPTLTPNHRQASPFPLESTNSRRHHYNGSVSSDRSRNGNGETVYAAPSKKTNTGGGGGGGGGGGTLGRRTRRGHASALSSSSTASDRSETVVFPDEHSRIHLGNGLILIVFRVAKRKDPIDFGIFDV